MQDFTKSYDSLAAAAEEILNQSQTEDSVDKEEIAEASNYEKKYGDRILRKLGKRKGKQITKREWDKADADQRSSWISSLPFSHSDDVAKYIGVSWEDLPTVAKVNMFEEALTEDESLTEAQYKMTMDGVSRALDLLSNALRKGSKLNKEVNTILDGNYDRDFKNMKDSIDKVFDTWEDIRYKAIFDIKESAELTEAKIEVPTDEKDIKAFLDKAKKLRATEKDFTQSMNPLDFKTFAKFDTLARGHKDFAGAYGIGYDAGMGYDLPKSGGLEGNNPHKKNTFAYYLWMDIAGQGMADA